MPGLIQNFPHDGVVTINRVILKPEYTMDDLQSIAFLCENVKTYHSETGFVGGFVALRARTSLQRRLYPFLGPGCRKRTAG